MDIFEEIVKVRSAGQNAALATITKVEGSTPRMEGAKMLIRSDGSIVGSVGGGSMEDRICKEAADVMREGRPKMVSIDLTGKQTVEDGMICGGKLEVFIEPIVSNPNLYIFGAGHISLSISKIAKLLGFRVIVIDDREEFANSERFAEADKVLVMDIKEVFDRISITPMSYIVIVTRGHLHDENALEQAIQTEAKYIGMIGSMKKIRTVFSSLEEKGIEEKLLKKVRAPIGLDIKAETPEEIAVSILAEIIMVRRGGQPPIAKLWKA